MISVRKLAALDIVFHGSKVVLGEFAVGVFLPLAISALSLWHSRSWLGFAFGLYMLALGINYLPLLMHAIFLVQRGDAGAEVSHELSDHPQSARKYGMQSLLLLVPLAIPALALAQFRSRLRSRH